MTKHIVVEPSREVAVEGPTRASSSDGRATAVAPTTHPSALPASGGQEPDAPPARTRRITRFLFTLVIVLSVLEAAAFGGNYLLNTRYYVSTDNAQVDGDKVDIAAPATGLVTGWTATQGSTVTRDEILGRVTIQGSKAQAQNTVKSPGTGTVAVSNVVNGEWVNAGDEMATAYNFSSIYVTARVSEDDIAAVHPGQQVDVAVDAYPNTSVTGVVEEVQASAAGQFSIYPGPDTDPTNPQKVDQYVPVKIAFTNTGGVGLSPGMNVTVHIRKDR